MTKETMKHTPGPWKLEKAYSWRIVNDDGVCVASPHGPQGEWDKVRDEHTANAALIASAPELLDAAKEAVKSVRQGSLSYKLLMQAIAKAEGRQ